MMMRCFVGVVFRLFGDNKERGREGEIKWEVRQRREKEREKVASR